jgi:enoyl-CoA hydratase/carnithine racemase
VNQLETLNDLEFWKCDVADGMLRLTLQGGGPHNALGAELLRELKTVAQWLSAPGRTRDVRVVLLEGAGRNFSAGIDPRIIQSMLGQDREAFAAHLRELQLCLDAFEAVPQPVVAAIRGFCIGGGMILAACCDFRYADSRAVFTLPEVKRGIGVIMGAARIARLVGMTAAKEWMLLGDRIRPEEARARGYLNAVVAPDRLEATALATARKLAALPGDAVRLNKRILDEGRTMTLRESQELEIELQGALLDSPDFRAAIESFFAQD